MNSVKLNPCPICGGQDTGISYHMHYGHGDSGYEGLRISCKNCECSVGNGYGYGEPSKEAINEVSIKWNNINKFKQ